MLTKSSLEVLRRAADGRLPRSVDEQTEDIDLAAFRELYRAGLIAAIDASADCGDAYLEPRITPLGREALRREVAAKEPWWSAFDRRVAIVGLVVAVLGLAATLGLLKAQ